MGEWTKGRLVARFFAYGAEKIAEMRDLGIEPVRIVGNDGTMPIVLEDGDLMASVVMRRQDVKRGERHTAPDSERDANAERLVACWNAMINVKDPAAFMEEVREVLEGFCPPKLAEIESLLWDGIDDSAHGTMTVTCGQMRRARALLAKMEGK